jgi:D,D-heptose 1,7-bisphosphate phosphatase
LTPTLKKAIFLDRDGTLNEEVSYLTDIKNIIIFKGVIEALKIFKQFGFLNIIITNQAAVAKGLLTEDELIRINEEFINLLSINGEPLIDKIYYSPFHIDGTVEKYKIENEDRKPGTGMIKRAMNDFSICLEESFLIGDKLTDMKCAQNAGIKKILVMTGHGKSELIKCYNENIFIEYIAINLLQAAEFIKCLSLKNKEINIV